MAHYLITGGCGFIGRTLASQLLAKDHSVSVLDDLSSGDRTLLPGRAKLHVGCITDAALVASLLSGVDGVFHLAAVASVEKCITDWRASSHTNHYGSVTVMDAAVTAGLPVVAASSAAVYGDQQLMPIQERSSLAPLSPYAADKIACEHHAATLSHLRGGRLIMMRPFNVYGKGQDPKSPYSGVITHFAKRLQAGHVPIVQGDGEQVRDFIHVKDVARGFAAAMARLGDMLSPTFEVYNMCSGTPTSINSLAMQMMQLYGIENRSPEYAPARAGDIRMSYGDPRRTEATLKVVSAVGLRDGLSETLF